ILHYHKHQKEVLTRRTKYQLDKAEREAHVLEGYLIALDHLDEVIELIRAAADAETARDGLMSQVGLSEIQAQAILEMRLRALTGLERKKVKDRHADLMELITELRAILADEDRLMALIREELLEVRAQFADDRRTEIMPAEGEIDLEQMIAEEDMVISITASGYIKRLALSTYRTQGRGGVGVMGMDTKDDDVIALKIRDGDELVGVRLTDGADDVLLVSRNGSAVRFSERDVRSMGRDTTGVAGMKLRAGDEVISVEIARDDQELLVVTENG